MTTDPEQRKAIALRSIERAKARGMPIDNDPEFVALLDAWVRGEIEMNEMRDRFLVLRPQRQANERKHRSAAVTVPGCLDPADDQDG